MFCWNEKRTRHGADKASWALPPIRRVGTASRAHHLRMPPRRHPESGVDLTRSHPLSNFSKDTVLVRGAFFLQQQPIDEEEAAAVAARLQTGVGPVEDWAPSAEKSSYVMPDSEPSKSASTKRIESKRQKSRKRKACLLASESRRNPQPGRRYLQAAKGRLQPSNPKRVPGRATVCRGTCRQVARAQGHRDQVEAQRASLVVGHQRDDADPKPARASAGL